MGVSLLTGYKFTPPPSKERLEVRYKANNNGEIRIPVDGLSLDTVGRYPYNWKVSVNGGPEKICNGIGGGSIIAAEGLTPGEIYHVKITPVVEDYAWLRAFGYSDSVIGYDYLIEVVYDGSEKGYLKSATDTGFAYRAWQFVGCTALTKIVIPPLPDSVEVVGNRSFTAMFRNCTALTDVTLYLPKQSVQLGNESYSLTMTGAGSSANPMTLTLIGDYCFELSEGNSMGLNNANVSQIKVKADLVNAYKNSSRWSNIDDSKFVAI